VADSAQRLDTITLAVPEPVDLAPAPIPASADQRLVFRQLFENLVRIDCQGQLQPALASSWRADSTGRSWTFALRDGVRVPYGSSLTAQMVESAWHSRQAALQSAGLESVSALDDTTLLVRMSDVRDSLPQLFADLLWSVGSVNLPGAPSGFRMNIPIGATGPVLQILAAPTGDLRDALDAGADLVISGDPQVIDYAARHPEFQTFPLPWDRTYALLRHWGSALRVAGSLDSAARLSLARDAVQTEARPAQSQAWWNNGPCALSVSMKAAVPTATRVVYQTTDPVARQLAERIVALAGDRPPLSVMGLDPVRFADALERGNDAGYIVALPFRSVAPCRESAEWTRRGYPEPLIDTRSRAIVRRGSPALTVDYDGTLRIVPPGNTMETQTH
jgi:hypothetical protein